MVKKLLKSRREFSAYSAARHFLATCPIFGGSVDNFGRSDVGPVIVKKCLFQLVNAYVVSYAALTKNLE